MGAKLRNESLDHLAGSWVALQNGLGPAPLQRAWDVAIGHSKIVDLYAETHGHGPPVLLLHGFGASIYTWRALIEPLAETHRVIAVDLKGSGTSPKPKDDRYSVLDQAALVHACIEKEDLRGLTLVGHSFGGGVALMTAMELLREPSPRISALVLIDSMGFPQKHPEFVRLLRIPVISRWAIQLFPMRPHIRKTLTLAYHRPERITQEQLSAYAAPLQASSARYALWKTAQQIVPPNIGQLTAGYSAVTVPTLILWGRYDRITPLRLGRRLHERIVNSQLRIIDDCGHIPHEEKPNETVAAIVRFLREQQAGKP